MQQTKIFCGIVSPLALLVLFVNAYAQVSLRSRVDSSRTFQTIQANCALEFANINGFTYVAFGGAGLAIYRYQPGQPPQRIGYSSGFGGITDLAHGPFRSLACVAGNNNVYLFSFRTSDLSLVPHGVARSGNAGLNAARVRSLRGLDIGNDSYLVVGTRTGRLRVYRLTAGSGGLPPASSFDVGFNVGNPIVDLPLFADSVRALAAWEFPARQQYIAVGGSDGIVYLYQHSEGSVRLIGKPMEHPAPVEEIVVNGNRLVVALRNGLVYVWNYTSNAVSYHLTIKEPWSPLTAYSLCALPNDRVAVATGSVRVYSLANGAQVGEYGVQVALAEFGSISDLWSDMSSSISFVRYVPTSVSPLIRLAPFVGNTSYFYVVGTNIHIRTAFLRPPAELLYQVFPSRHPVYAGVSLRTGNPPIAVGLGNGEVRTPWGTRNVGEPVYALAVTGPNNQPWLLGSYGIGRIFAWSSSNNFVANILPQGAPRILYSVRIVAYDSANNIVRFVTAGGDGRIELWQWNASTPNNPATLLSHQSVSHPLHYLTVNASRTQLAVSSITAPYDNNQRCAWRLSLSGTSLGAATPIERAMRVVAYHPTNPDLLAWGGTFRGDYWWRGSILLDRPNQQPHFLVRSADAAYVTWLDWSSDGRLLLAAYSKGFVYVLSPDGARNNPKNRDGTTDNEFYGNPFDALRAVYQPHRGYIYAVSAVDNNILTAGADGQAKLFSASGTPVFEIVSPPGYARLTSIDYLPNGGVVTPERVVYPPSTSYSPFANLQATAALWIPNTSTAFYSPFVVQEIQNNQLRVAGDTQLRNDLRVEISENGQWLLHTFIEGRSNSQPGSLRALILQRTPSWPYFSRSNERLYQLYQYASRNTPLATAFSPTGEWIATVATERVINLYRRSAITGNNPSPSARITYNAATPIYSLKFLADDVLAVLHTANNIMTLDVWYRRQDGTWGTQPHQTITLQGLEPYHFRYGGGPAYYPIDAVAPSGSSSVRVVLSARGTLIFYRMNRSSSGVPNLVEVGRATSASNGYLDIPDISWVRFSRHNPNILGVVQALRTAITYDLTGLFDW